LREIRDSLAVGDVESDVRQRRRSTWYVAEAPAKVEFSSEINFKYIS